MTFVIQCLLPLRLETREGVGTPAHAQNCVCSRLWLYIYLNREAAVETMK